MKKLFAMALCAMTALLFSACGTANPFRFRTRIDDNAVLSAFPAEDVAAGGYGTYGEGGNLHKTPSAPLRG